MRTLVLLALGLAVARCAQPPPATSVPALDPAYFENVVEPELLTSCAWNGCHGAPARPLRLFSPAGLRLADGTPSTTPLSPEERQANRLRAAASAAATSAELPDLLRKPLQREAGGAGHGGVDRFGRNVYASKDDARWRALAAWVGGATWDGGAGDGDAGVEEDAGSPADGGAGPMACLPRVGNGYAPVAGIVTKVTCAKDQGCHTPENRADAGCFVADDTCESLRRAGCVAPSVRPCDLARSRLLQYTGARPWGVKSHQNALTPLHAAAIADWIDGGASCDGGGPWP